jgi:4-aminobutyrate aminotransferase-like enzyme
MNDLRTTNKQANGTVLAVYDLCKKYKILFMADEVRQGAGKTGKFFCYENLGADVKPDLIAMGKSMAVLTINTHQTTKTDTDHTK